MALNIESKILKSYSEFMDKRKGTIGICSGCFDILQSGHAVFLSKCKEFVDILIVVVGSDIAIKKQKGSGRPINPQNNRLFLIAALVPVDYVILGEDNLKPGKLDFVDIVNNIKPDFLFLNNDDGAIKEKAKFCLESKMELILLERTVPDFLIPTSSSEIINKLKIRE